MADFTTARFQANTGTNASPVWTAVPAQGAGTGQEIRFSDLSTQGATASASWPFTTRPTSGTSGVDYAYVFTADTTSLGFLGTTSTTPAAFTNASYLQFRFDWDNLGTYASAPIFTAYASNAHAAISRGDGSILGGHASDTGGTARSYLKGNMFGRVTSAGAPAAAPGSAPTVTDGATGATSPTAGANWAAWSGLQGDNDWLAFPSTPAATTADQINLMIRLFMGTNETPSTYTPVVSWKYTYT